MYGNYKISTQPATEPVTLAEAKTHLRVDVSTDDTYITTLISAARQFVEKYLNRALIDTTYTVDLDCLPLKINLLYCPVSSVTSIQYYDTAGTQQTLASNQYIVSTNKEPGEITPAYGVDYPTIQDRADAVTVTYVAGYGSSASDVPEAIRQCILILVGDMYDNRVSQVREKMSDLMDFYIQQYRIAVLPV